MDDLARNIVEEIQICEHGPWMLPEDTRIPSGKEQGDALVIGVGGSTLRLTHVHIKEHGGSTSTALLSTPVTEDAKADLFAWCASQIVPVLDAYCQGEPPLLAVSWSFPLLRGRVLCMGKSFGTKYDGKTVVDLFNASLPERYRVQSVTHDGASSLVAGIHENPQCIMALTLGSGVNINLNYQNTTIVNTEISMLGRGDTTPNIKLCTAYFDIADDRSALQPLEAQVGGLYLGEMVSRALQEEVSTLDVWQILDQKDDARFPIVNMIVYRAASLVAAAIYGLLLFSQIPGGEVVYTGGVIFEPHFRARLQSQLAALAEKHGFSVRLVPQRAGSEIGAAISALHN